MIRLTCFTGFDNVINPFMRVYRGNFNVDIKDTDIFRN